MYPPPQKDACMVHYQKIHIHVVDYNTVKEKTVCLSVSMDTEENIK